MRVVDHSTETFRLARLLDTYDLADGEIEDWDDYLNQRLQKIERLFLEKKASPHDVDLEGRTLLHVGSRKRFWQCH